MTITKLSDSSRIIILCTGNSCRSQIAEGFMRHFLLNEGYVNTSENVCSAGLETHGLNPRAVLVMSEIGIDISSQRSTNVSEYLDQTFDFVITVCDHAASYCPTFHTEGIKLHWPFKDPALVVGSESEIMDEFRAVRDQISDKIQSWVSQ